MRLATLDYRATADANEQYQSLDDLRTLVDTIRNDPALAPLASVSSISSSRSRAKTPGSSHLGQLVGLTLHFIIDEADDSYDAFPRAKALGYRGVSIKSCKGTLQVTSQRRPRGQWSKRPAITSSAAEDLTCQAGPRASSRTRRSSPFTASPMPSATVTITSTASPTRLRRRRSAFLTAHPDLYERSSGTVRLSVRDGAIATGSLAAPGFACALEPAQIGSTRSRKNEFKEFAS